ncbi:M90 family metallopeptidase [Marinobacter bohaiensis]|uniref:M90 family metallopeptidase n=1 Tax=Marinobacter bohaiensis TaxID=2201898 RepID=UPI0013A69AB8|nr:M90 family metallopeptidase [Marinobacter bohaiensis]
MLYFLGVVALIALAAYRLFFYRGHRRAQVAARDFPDQWRQLLQAEMALYGRLTEPVRQRVESGTLILLDELDFYGCNGLEVTEPMRVLIAAHGALLVSGLSPGYYDSLRAVLLYPDVYRAPIEHHEDMVVTEGEDSRLGESWGEGRVILVWPSVAEDAADPHARNNVTLHEFAHQLDQLDGASDGAPPLRSRRQSQDWQAVFSDAWNRLKRDAEWRDTVLDPYGATDPAEFFAVATEAFFCTPEALRESEPDLYRCLADFYQLSPADWAART